MSPLGLGGLAIVGYALRDCGFGVRGFYYGQRPTHDEAHEYHSIDFTSYRRGVPYINASAGTEVLSVAIGIVKQVADQAPTGSRHTANKVWVDQYSDQEFVAALITAAFAGRLPRSTYNAHYVHLDGPNMVSVSPGMHVDQGTVLGLMDDTGNSVISHLHFSLHDNTRPNRPTVFPSPMDGERLRDRDDNKCMPSTNDPVP